MYVFGPSGQGQILNKGKYAHLKNVICFSSKAYLYSDDNYTVYAISGEFVRCQLNSRTSGPQVRLAGILRSNGVTPRSTERIRWLVKWCRMRIGMVFTCWRHQVEKKYSATLALCEGNPPVTGGFPLQRPVTRSFDVFFDLHLNKRLSKQSRRRWFVMLSRSLWRHCNDLFLSLCFLVMFVAKDSDWVFVTRFFFSKYLSPVQFHEQPSTFFNFKTLTNLSDIHTHFLNFHLYTNALNKNHDGNLKKMVRY